MTPNPFLGVVYHWLGGLASGSFYVPYRLVRRWSWEVSRIRTSRQDLSPRDISTPAADLLASPTDAPAQEMARAAPAPDTPAADRRVPLAANYLSSALAGVTWYLQFVFYTMGETQMGRFGCSSWTLHMASIIIFSSVWGIALREWTGASVRARSYPALALSVLVASTSVVGVGNTLAKDSKPSATTPDPAATASAAL